MRSTATVRLTRSVVTADGKTFQPVWSSIDRRFLYLCLGRHWEAILVEIIVAAFAPCRKRQGREKGRVETRLAASDAGQAAPLPAISAEGLKAE